MTETKDFILAIENLEIDILKTADELDGYESSNGRKNEDWTIRTIARRKR